MDPHDDGCQLRVCIRGCSVRAVPAGDPEGGAGRTFRSSAAGTLRNKSLANVLHKLGFRESVLQPGFFIHQQKEVHVVTHVDDFLCAGPVEDLKWFKQALSENFDISGQCIGNYDEKNKTRVRTLKFLGWRISKVANGRDWEADPKHIQILRGEEQ